MTLRFNNDMLLDAYKRMYKYIKNHDKLPPHLEIINSDGERVKLKPKEYAGLYESMHAFILNNGRYPKYVNLISEANNPLVFDRQNTSYTCCPTSLSMASQMLYHYHSEETCAKALGTSPNSGTSPSQLIAGAPKLGLKAIPIERDSKVVKTYIDKGFPVICHWQTNQTKNCKGDYISAFGHYGLIWDMTSTHYLVADPAKGVNRKYKFKCLDNANREYRQNYYVIKPK